MAHPGGWFSYKLKVDPDGQNVLKVTYVAYQLDRALNIYADGELLVREKAAFQWSREFITKHYPIPAEIVKGKTQVEFKFATEDRWTGIFGVLRTMRPIAE